MIRKATIEDIPYIQDVCNIEGLYSPTGNVLEDYWLEELIKNDIFFYVYEKNNKIIGVIFGEKLISDGILLWVCGVLEEYNNKGYGARLLKFFEQKCKEQNIKWILVYGYDNNKTVESGLKRLNYVTTNELYKEYQ
jgi:N-acetylglutamate synthase-like GNAT family acetyltransferase